MVQFDLWSRALVRLVSRDADHVRAATHDTSTDHLLDLELVLAALWQVAVVLDRHQCGSRAVRRQLDAAHRDECCRLGPIDWRCEPQTRMRLVAWPVFMVRVATSPSELVFEPMQAALEPFQQLVDLMNAGEQR